MINGEKNISNSVPVFVPPRKRQTSKKQNGVQNYVDHIVSVQVCKPQILHILCEKSLTLFILLVN